MDVKHHAVQEQIPFANRADDANDTIQDVLEVITLVASTEVGPHGRQSDGRPGIPNEVLRSTLDLRPIDFAAHGSRSRLQSEASYGQVLEWPLRIDTLPTMSHLAECIVRSIPVAFVVLDPSLRVRQANPAFYDLFRVSPSETEQHDFFELGTGQWDIPWLRASLIQIQDLDIRLQDSEVEHVFPAIGRRTVRLEGRRLVGPGNDDLILLTFEDITARKAIEQQQRDFILLLAHELRNPLAAIMGYAQRMRKQKGSGEAALTVIMAQARQLNRLVGDLLDGSARGVEQLRLEPCQMDLVSVVRGAAKQAQALDPPPTFRLELPELPITGHWDRGRLVQVFDNLLGNAVKYSPAGGEIVVRIENLGTTAQVSIQDRGIGIAPEEIPHLFDQFYRVAATAHRAQGLGMGLHIAKVLVEAHGGSISVESVPGLGSTFRVTLPLTSPESRGYAAKVSGPSTGWAGAMIVISRRDGSPDAPTRALKSCIVVSSVPDRLALAKNPS